MKLSAVAKSFLFRRRHLFLRHCSAVRLLLPDLCCVMLARYHPPNAAGPSCRVSGDGSELGAGASLFQPACEQVDVNAGVISNQYLSHWRDSRTHLAAPLRSDQCKRSKPFTPESAI